MEETPPRISVEQSGRALLDEQGLWPITWRIHNLEKEPMTIRAAQLPHGQFKGEQRTFEKGLTVGARDSTFLKCSVICQGASGSVVDNVFLILHVDWRQSAWRIFVRLQVVFDKKAEPRTKIELITTQRAGFSRDQAPASCDG